MFNIDQILRTLQTDEGTQRQAMTGAAGLAAGMLLGRGGFGNMARMGAIAAVGGLAYKAWQAHQAQQGKRDAVDEERFIPPAQAGYQHEELSKTLVRAMIAATKADGQIDATEKDAIFRKLETMPLGAEEKAFVFDELSSRSILMRWWNAPTRRSMRPRSMRRRWWRSPPTRPPNAPTSMPSPTG
jgi:uncharacterized membrane protein YebE (DUF533 family)